MLFFVQNDVFVYPLRTKMSAVGFVVRRCRGARLAVKNIFIGMPPGVVASLPVLIAPRTKDSTASYALINVVPNIPARCPPIHCGVEATFASDYLLFACIAVVELVWIRMICFV